jgi:hypothetical protein
MIAYDFLVLVLGYRLGGSHIGSKYIKELSTRGELTTTTPKVIC